MIDKYKWLDKAAKVITLYMFFYGLAKWIAIAQGYPKAPNLIIGLLLFLWGAWGWWVLKNRKSPLAYVILGIAAIILLRIYEVDLAAWLQNL